MGFDFIVIAPLLPSHCGFSFVFGYGVSFLVSSSVFLSMIVLQLVVIPVLSQKGVNTCPSTLPFLNHDLNKYFFKKICSWDFPAGAVVKKPPASAEDMGSCPGLGRSHMLRSN